MPDLPRALRALANDARTGLTLRARLGAAAARWGTSPFSAAVPPTCHKAAGTSGIQRTITVNQRESMSWAHARDLRTVSGPKLHGMQVFTGYPLRRT